MAVGGPFRTWWQRLRGQLEPRPFPYSEAAILDSPLRRAFASPARILGAFGLAAGERVLEVGCGTGYYSSAAAARVGESGRLVCLDVQQEMLLETRQRLESAGYAAHFVRANASALPFASSTFDRAFLITALGEIPERSRAIGEIRRILRARGRLSVSEQLPDPDFVTLATLRRELRDAGFSEESTRRHFAIAYSSTWSE
jgi:ubiquinone/menaquinone biosynthesis C-methylase UbiE